MERPSYALNLAVTIFHEVGRYDQCYSQGLINATTIKPAKTARTKKLNRYLARATNHNHSRRTLVR